MPKVKTKRAVAKRFKVTKKGKGNKILRRHAYKSHILTKKSANRKRRLRKPDLVSDADKKHVLYALGKR